MQGRVTEKKIAQSRSEEKKFMQSELHCRALKLYPPEWQLGSHFKLHTLYLAATLNSTICDFVGL